MRWNARRKSLPNGFDSARSLLQRSLHEEQNMAEWIEGHLRDLTMQYLRHEELERAR
jgi:ferritin-like metal-binding protein YciE